MQTLSKEITASFYKDAEGYARLTARWSGWMQDRAERKRFHAAHHLLYLILRGKNWQKAFAPVTNPAKLANGGFYAWGGRRAIRRLHSEGEDEESLLAPFAEFLDGDALRRIRELVPKPAWDENPLDREPYHD